MSELIQMNTHVPAHVAETVEDLWSRYPWSRRDAVMTAIDSLSKLMGYHEDAAAKASSEDARALYLKVACAMPARLALAKVVEAQFKDGRPALQVDLDGSAAWLIADDRNGDLMCVRPDGSQVGHITNGDIEPLSVGDLAVAEVGSLT